MKNKIYSFLKLFFCFAFFALCLCAFLINYKIYPLHYKMEIEKYAEMYDIEASFIASIINVESNFKIDAKSNKGAIGLMQIVPKTAKFICEKIDEEYYDSILLEPEKNIKIGTYYIFYLLKKFHSKSTVLCAYNAGEGKTAEWLKNSSYSTDGITVSTIPFKETSTYVKRVLKNYNVYKMKI